MMIVVPTRRTLETNLWYSSAYSECASNKNPFEEMNKSIVLTVIYCQKQVPEAFDIMSKTKRGSV